MKSTAEILELLRIYKTQSASKYGFKRLGVFGSVARGEQTGKAAGLSGRFDKNT